MTHQAKSFELFLETNRKMTKNVLCFLGKVIFAIKSHQVLSFPILKPIHKYVKNVYQSPLLRVYAKYPVHKGKSWFHDLRRTTTKWNIKTDYTYQLQDRSYHGFLCRRVDINKMRDKSGNVYSDNKLLKIIQNELKALFPSITIRIHHILKAIIGQKEHIIGNQSVTQTLSLVLF